MAGELTEQQKKLAALLIWLEQQGGSVDADHPGLDRYSHDYTPVDTINQAFGAGLAKQWQNGEDCFSVHITAAGRRALAERPAKHEET